MTQVDLIRKRLLPNSIRIPLIKAIIEAAVSHCMSWDDNLRSHTLQCVVFSKTILCCVFLCCVMPRCVMSCLDILNCKSRCDYLIYSLLHSALLLLLLLNLRSCYFLIFLIICLFFLSLPLLFLSPSFLSAAPLHLSLTTLHPRIRVCMYFTYSARKASGTRQRQLGNSPKMRKNMSVY